MSNYVNTIVSVRKDHKEWLKEHPEINFSGFVRVKLQELIETDKKNNKKNKK